MKLKKSPKTRKQALQIEHDHILARLGFTSDQRQNWDHNGPHCRASQKLMIYILKGVLLGLSVWRGKLPHMATLLEELVQFYPSTYNTAFSQTKCFSVCDCE